MVKPLPEEFVMSEMLSTWNKAFGEPKKLHSKTKVPAGFFIVNIIGDDDVLRTFRTHKFKRIGQGDFAGQAEMTGLWEGFDLEEEKFLTEHLGDTLQELRGHRQMVFAALKSTDASDSIKQLKCWKLKELSAPEKAKKFPQVKRNEARASLMRTLMEELAYGEKQVTEQLLKFYEAHPKVMKAYSQPGKMAGRVRSMCRELFGDKSLKYKAQVLQVREVLMGMGCEQLAKAY